MGREDEVSDRRPALVRVSQGDGLGAARGTERVRLVQRVVVRPEVRRRQHRLHVQPLRPLLLHQRQRGQLPGKREALRRRPRGPQRARPAGCRPGSFHAAVDSHAADFSAEAEPVVVASLSGSYSRACSNSELSTISDSFGSCPCSHDNSELATVAGVSGSVTVAFAGYPWRRAAATISYGQRTGRRGAELDQRSERNCSGGGRLRHLAGSVHWLRHACYLKRSAVMCSFVQGKLGDITDTVKLIYLCIFFALVF